MPDPVAASFTPEQLEDLVELLSAYVNPGNLRHFGSLALGRDISKEAANEVADPDPVVFVRRVVQVLSDADKLWELIAKIKEQAHQNSYFAVNLATVLSGQRLRSAENLQAFLDETQPVFLNARVHEIERALCAIGLGEGVNRLVGSGFLVGADLVLTNYHVLKNYLKIDAATGTVVENGAGDQVFCFFDYVSPPAPAVPPIEGRAQRYVTVRALATGWLHCARIELADDGGDEVEVQNSEYDYVLIRLEREVGNAPVAPSGGEPRGWLSLPAVIDTLGVQRLLLVQHPGGAPQSFDIGEFDSLDHSTTRVRYRVNSERGSSGSPAVGQDGVFAIHNAAVKLKRADGRQLNQGVRIDRIVQDLTLTGWSATKPSVSPQPLRFWSLNENLSSPRPIIGRGKFMDHVKAMSDSAGERVLVVYGPEGSGRHFSVDLLRRCLPDAEVVRFTPEELATLEPAEFLRVLVDGLAVRGASEVEIPAPNPHEGLPQWLRRDLPGWLSARLTADALRAPTRYPAWVVIDLVSDGRPLRWAKHLRDFLAGLAGVRDPGQTPVDIPQLRWLVLGPTADPLSLTGVNRREEDLAARPDVDDVMNCLRLAWYSIGYADEPWGRSNIQAFLGFAGIVLDQAQRKELADVVAKLVVAAPKRKK